VNFSGTTQINDLNSLIGRAGLRFGTTVTTGNLVLQPFASVSVWHDFDKDYSANYASCAGCFFVFGVPSSFTATATTQNIGTFGQYSLGISGQVINTGWLGFARVDYRDGNRMEGLSATGGIRYQFTPTEVASKMLVKAPVIADIPVNWTGWYIGANTGGNYGHSSIVFPGVSSSEEHSAGFFAGGTLGYNYQVGNWVYGLEGDVSWTNTRASSQCAPLTDTTPGAGGFSVQTQLFQMTCHDNLDWTATAAARLGYLWGPRTLLYVKAGGAFGSETASMSCNLGPINGTPAQGGLQNCVNPALIVVNRASASDVRAGWTAGFGTEFALTQRWFATGEFDYMDFGTKSLTLNDGTLISSTQRIAQGKIGLNYKFSP